jgi:hypothetical protein
MPNVLQDQPEGSIIVTHLTDAMCGVPTLLPTTAPYPTVPTTVKCEQVRGHEGPHRVILQFELVWEGDER